MRRLTSTSLLVVGAATLLGASPLLAQKVHGGGGAPTAHPMPKPYPEPAVNRKQEEMHESDRAKQEEAMHAARRAGKADEKMEDRAEHAARKTAKRAEKAEDRAEKALDRTERHALNAARHDGRNVIHGIRLTSAQRALIRAIDRKYDAQLRALASQDRANEKAGRPDDATLVAKINAIRDQERAEIRATLTTAQQAQFDRNVATRH